MKNEVMEVFELYDKALSKGDFDSVFKTMSDDIICHMGGEGPLSGTIIGKKKLGECLVEFSKRSNGTFKIETKWASNNQCFVAASVISLAEKNGKKLANPGVDLFRIENGKIKEVWTFGEYQKIEDEFWK